MNKKGFQVSINMLVVIILGIVILGVGIKIATDVFGGAGKFSEDFSEQREQELVKLMFSDGQQIALLTPTLSTTKKESIPSIIGVRNTMAGSKEFFILAVPNDGLSKDYAGNEIFNAKDYMMKRDGIIKTETFSLEPHETRLKKLFFVPERGMVAGTYVYDVYVCYDDVPTDSSECGSENTWYTGNLLRLTVKVK